MDPKNVMMWAGAIIAGLSAFGIGYMVFGIGAESGSLGIARGVDHLGNAFERHPNMGRLVGLFFMGIALFIVGGTWKMMSGGGGGHH